jgi:hypothetical protein
VLKNSSGSVTAEDSICSRKGRESFGTAPRIIRILSYVSVRQACITLLPSRTCSCLNPAPK